MISIKSSLSNYSTLSVPLAPVPWQPQDLSTYPSLYNLNFSENLPANTVLLISTTNPYDIPKWTLTHYRVRYMVQENLKIIDYQGGALGFFGGHFNTFMAIENNGFHLNAGTYYVTFKCASTAGITNAKGVSFEYSINNAV